MKLLLLAAVVLDCVFISWTVDLDLPYDCRAYGCVQGTGNSCPTEGGDCTCAAGADADHQCSTVRTASDDAQYTCSSCVAESTIGGGSANCDSERPGECLCAAGSTGTTCDTARLEASCLPYKVIIRVNPYRPVGSPDFDGLFYLSPTNDFGDFDSIDDSCKTQIGDASWYIEMFFAASPGSSLRCLTSVDVEPETHTAGYKVYVYIQHNHLYRSDLDQVIEIFCSSSAIVNSDSAIFTVSNANTVSSGSPLPHTVYASSFGLTMALKAASNNDITGTVTVGSPIGVVIDYNTDPFTIEECIASDVSTFDSSNQVTLIEDWCVSPRAVGLFSGVWEFVADGDTTTIGGTTSSNGFGIKFYLKAWYFVGSSSNNLHIQCAVCIDCNPTGLADCTNDLTSFTDQRDALSTTRRRRREGGDAGRRVNTTMSVYVEIARGSGSDAKVTTGDESLANTVSCYKNTSVLLPVTLLAALLFVTIATTVFFYKKATRMTDVAQTKNPTTSQYTGY